MIHGRTKIELYNANTKIKKVIESENTFQSGVLQNYFRQYGCFDASPYWDSDSHKGNTSWQNMIGGLFLFKNGIDVGTKYMPAGNEMVGNASWGVVHTGNPTELGSWNENESGATARAITQVYDFTTDQANGNIGCVCLTSQVGGQIGYGNHGETNYSNYQMNWGQKNGSYNQAVRNYVFEAWSKNYQHNFSLDSDGVLTVTRTHRPITAGNIFEGFSNTLTFDLSESIPSAQRGLGMPEVVADGIIRMFVGSQTEIPAGGSALYIEYNSVNRTAEVKTLVNSSNVTVKVGYNCFSKFVLGDYAVLVAHSAWVVIKVDTGVLVGVLQLEFDPYDWGGASDTLLDSYPDAIGDGLIVYRYGSSSNQLNTRIFDCIAGTIKTINLQSKAGGAQVYSVCTQHGEYDIMRGILNYNRGIVIKNPLYLATINNIQPVSKTAAQTMKVTYTLTEVE